MSEPLDQDLAQTLDPDGVKVTQDPHIGTGISNTVLVNWGKLAAYQVRKYHPNAVVVFIGANDGYSMPGPGGKQVNCCSAEWAAIYASRVREMMNTYRQDGVGSRLLADAAYPSRPRPSHDRARRQCRDRGRRPALGDQIRIIDTVPVFTPGDSTATR